MTRTEISYRDLYELVDKRTNEIMQQFERLESRVGVLENWKSEIIGKMAMVTAVVMVGVTLVMDWFRKRIGI